MREFNNLDEYKRYIRDYAEENYFDDEPDDVNAFLEQIGIDPISKTWSGDVTFTVVIRDINFAYKGDDDTPELILEDMVANLISDLSHYSDSYDDRLVSDEINISRLAVDEIEVTGR